MNNAGKMFGLVVSVALAVSETATADNLNIQQVPINSVSTEQQADGEASIRATNRGGTDDYQNDILNNPTLNERARAEAIMNSGEGGGNTAVITQSGNNNHSSIRQKGNNNYASQTQDGKHNDLRVEQNGKNNVSVENQKGDYNHKVKIQNGHTTEETNIEQVPGNADEGSKD